MKGKGKFLVMLLTAVTVFCTALSGCGAPGGEQGGGRAQVSDEIVTYYGEDNGEVLHNPLMGWSYYAFPWEIIRYGIPDEFDVGYILCSWDQIEKEQGTYDFDLLTRAVNRLRQDGKTVYLRLYLMPDDVWGVEGYPAWVKDVDGVGNFFEVNTGVLSGSFKFSHPDYLNKVYQGLVAKFLASVRSEYADGAVDVIDLRAYGLYGEWDSDWGNYWEAQGGDYKADKTRALNDFVDLYKVAFGDYERTKIAINVSSKAFSTAEEHAAYEKEAAYDNAMGAGFALRYDAVANTFNANQFLNTLFAKYYPGTPVFAETVYGWDLTNLNVAATYTSFCKVHSNIATFGFFKGNYENAIEYNKNFFTDTLRPNENGDVIGYRILPSKVQYNKEANTDGKIHFSSEWKNLGAGILYNRYGLGLSLTDAEGKEVYFAVRDDFDITELTKEGGVYRYASDFNLPGSEKLPAGTYTLRLALVDETNNHKSTIAMPIGGDDGALNYAVGEIILK